MLGFGKDHNLSEHSQAPVEWGWQLIGASASRDVSDHRAFDGHRPFADSRGSRPNPLVTSLKRFGRLGPDEIAAIARIPSEAKLIKAGAAIVAEGSEVECICLIDQGIAIRHKQQPGVRRQILGYLISGDICDIDLMVVNQPNYSVTALSDCSVVSIPIALIETAIAQFPSIERALAHAASVNAAMLREWLSNVGQRNAYQRLGHFLCEMFVRFQAVGLTDGNGALDLPINQADLADTMGLTSVHISRTLQRLRNDQLIYLSRRHLKICDPRRLAEVAGFDANYLSLSHRND